MEKMKMRLKSVFYSSDEHPTRTAQRIEAEAEFGLGAIVPPELFQLILHFVSRDDRRRQVHDMLMKTMNRKAKDYGSEERRYRQEMLKAGPRYTLRSCSLVCCYWANQSRHYMFNKATLNIRSLNQATQFRYYATQGSERLGSICKMISVLEVHQPYSSSRSFTDLVYFPATYDKILRLFITGPVPAGFSLSRLNTPHWGFRIPTALPPHVTAYQYLVMDDIHYSSFSHVLDYLKHFKDTKEFRLDGLRWSGKVAFPVARWQHDKAPVRYRKTRSITAKGCTDDLFLCTQTAMMYSDFALRIVPEQDEHWALGMMEFLRGFYSTVPAHDKTSISYKLVSSSPAKDITSAFSIGVDNVDLGYPRTSIRFVCAPKARQPGNSRAHGRTSPEPIRIAGILVMIEAALRPTSAFRFSTVDLALLRTEIEKCCALRVVVLAFDDYATLEALTQRHPELLQSLSGQRTYMFACHRTLEHPFPEVSNGDGDINRTWVAIDPLTLKTTGEQWTLSASILPALLKSRLSFVSS